MARALWIGSMAVLLLGAAAGTTGSLLAVVLTLIAATTGLAVPLLLHRDRGEEVTRGDLAIFRREFQDQIEGLKEALRRDEQYVRTEIKAARGQIETLRADVNDIRGRR